MIIMVPLANVPVFLFTLYGAKENGTLLFELTLTYSVLILALIAGNGNNKLFCFRTSDVFRMRKNFIHIYTQRSRGYFHSRLPTATLKAVTVAEQSLSSLDQCYKLSIENLCLTSSEKSLTGEALHLVQCIPTQMLEKTSPGSNLALLGCAQGIALQILYRGQFASCLGFVWCFYLFIWEFWREFHI